MFIVKKEGQDYWREWVLGNEVDRILPRPWTTLTNDEIDYLAKKAYISFHFRFIFIIRSLIKLKSLTDAKSYMKVIDEFKTTKFDLDSAPGSKVKINPTKPLVDPRARFQPKIDVRLLGK